MSIDDLKEKYSDPLIYIRGDSNVNDNNKERAKIFDNFCNTLHMTNIPTNHKAYHHFLGDGLFDSCIDVILESSSEEPKERIEKIFCQSDFPEVDSHHDAIFSMVSIPVHLVPEDHAHFLSAPRLENTRHRILWSDEDIPDYQSISSNYSPKPKFKKKP